MIELHRTGSVECPISLNEAHIIAIEPTYLGKVEAGARITVMPTSYTDEYMVRESYSCVLGLLKAGQ